MLMYAMLCLAPQLILLPTLRPSHAGQALLFSLDHHGAAKQQITGGDPSVWLAMIYPKSWRILAILFFSISTGFIGVCIYIYSV